MTVVGEPGEEGLRNGEDRGELNLRGEAILAGAPQSESMTLLCGKTNALVYYQFVPMQDTSCSARSEIVVITGIRGAPWT